MNYTYTPSEIVGLLQNLRIHHIYIDSSHTRWLQPQGVEALRGLQTAPGVQREQGDDAEVGLKAQSGRTAVAAIAPPSGAAADAADTPETCGAVGAQMTGNSHNRV